MTEASVVSIFIPEFPGQTHIFFWREIRALERLGIKVDLISTRKPSAAVMSHCWSSEAIRRTTYLLPLSPGRLASATWILLSAGPSGWWRCVRAVVEADATAGYKFQMLAMVLIGADLAAVARRSRWGHVHVHSCANAANIAMFARLLAGVRYSLTLHSALSTFGPAQNVKWRYAEFGTAVTRRLRRDLIERVDVSPEKIDVAAMGVDLDVFRRNRPYQPWCSHLPFRVVTCGRLHPGKGHQDLIRAVAQLRAEGIPADLTVLGEGSGRAELEGLIAEIDATLYVRLAGAVSEGRVCSELENSHVFALVSHDEAIGVATMEAMAMGLPVVVTNVGGVDELVRNGVDGLMVPARDVCAIANALKQVMNDCVFADQAGKEGAQRVRERFGADVSATALANRLR